MDVRELPGVAVSFRPRRERLDRHQPLKELSQVGVRGTDRLDIDRPRLPLDCTQDEALCVLTLRLPKIFLRKLFD